MHEFWTSLRAILQEYIMSRILVYVKWTEAFFAELFKQILLGSQFDRKILFVFSLNEQAFAWDDFTAVIKEA